MTISRAATSGEASAVAALRCGDAAARLRALREIKNQVIGACGSGAAHARPSQRQTLLGRRHAPRARRCRRAGASPRCAAPRRAPARGAHVLGARGDSRAAGARAHAAPL
jgi:hypothetical protein